MSHTTGYRGEQSPGTISTVLASTCVVALLGLPAIGLAESNQDDSAEPGGVGLSVDEIALQLSNPITGLRTLDVDMEFRTYQGDLPGADKENFFRTLVTTSWPIEMSNGRQLMLRATIPFNGNQPLWKPNSAIDYPEFVIRQAPSIDPVTGEFREGHDHIGDVSFEVSYGGANNNGLVSTWGIVNVLPTSEDKSGSRGQWLVGPEVAFGQFTDWGLYGVRARHLTDVAGEGKQDFDFKTNETTLRLFFAYGLGNGWQIKSNPIILYDWEAVSGNKWSVPVGAGASKTLMLGRMPVKMAFELQNYVVSPDRFGPEWLLRFSVTPVISSKGLR